MTLITATKHIGASGTSKIIPVTKEVKQLGIKENGDIKGAFCDPDSEEQKILDFVPVLGNKDAKYVNQRYLKAGDMYSSGETVEEIACERKDAAFMTSLLDGRDALIRELDRGIIGSFGGRLIDYSARDSSFVLHTQPVDFEKDHQLMSVLSEVKLLKQMVSTITSDIHFNALLSYKDLNENLKDLCSDIGELCSVPEEERYDLVNSLNEKRYARTRHVTYKTVWFVQISTRYYMVDDYTSECERPTISLIEAIDYDDAKSSLESELSQIWGKNHQSGIIGPFKEKSHATEIMNYLSIEQKLNGWNFGDIGEFNSYVSSMESRLRNIHDA